MEKYRNNAQQRALKLLLAMAGHEINGISPTELATGLGLPAPTITRDLANLYLAGIAEQIQETQRWRLTPKLPQIAISMLSEMDRAQIKLDEAKQRYTRN